MKAKFKTGSQGVLTAKQAEKQLIPFENNRNKKDGIVRKRVDTIKALIESGLFYSNANGLINQQGILLDRHHTVRAFIELGKDVHYTVTPIEEANTTDPETLANIISRINHHDPRWSQAETFNAAIKVYKLAKFIQSEQIEIANLLNNVDGTITNKTIKHNWVFGILDRDSSLFVSPKKLGLIGEYNRPDLLTHSKTTDYKKDKQTFVALVKLLISAGITRYSFFTGLILAKYWSNEMNIDIFFAQAKKYGLKTLLACESKPKIAREVIMNLYYKNRKA